MPRDSNNTYTLPEAPFQPNTVAQPTPVNNNFSDIATALTASFTRGETTAFSRSLLDDADAATARGTLGGTATGVAVFTAADAAAARATLGVPAAPQPAGVSGPGEIVAIAPPAGVGFTLPAGGTWLVFVQRFNSSTGAFLFVSGFSVLAGGTALATPGAGERLNGFAWRIA
jgi:hypothetical protein